MEWLLWLHRNVNQKRILTEIMLLATLLTHRENAEQ